MSTSSSAPVLILYSNPEKTDRLRLDKEHRAMDAMLRRIGQPLESIRRMHATSVNDLLGALKEECYRIIHFSGHGDKNGIIVESDSSDAPAFLSVERLQNIVSLCELEPRAIILMCCYSTDILPCLLKSSPYVITITGPGDDEACIEFSVSFYETYFTTDSVETAFAAARKTLYAKGLDLTAILSRRAEGHPPRPIFRVFPGQREDSILVDIAPIEAKIDSLGISRDAFLKVLTQKIRVHKWLFHLPKEEAIIPVGPYFGVFTWKAPNDLVICERLLAVKSGALPNEITVWTAMLLTYNDLFVDRYRAAGGSPNPPGYEKNLRKAIDAFHKVHVAFMKSKERVELFERVAPVQFGITKGIMEHNLERADEMWAQEQTVETVIALETILTTFHDLVNAISERLIE